MIIFEVTLQSMIEYSRFELDNGLRVVVHEDHSSPMVAVNILYGVGSKDESPEKTGFAHLFEHLMFGGSEHIKDFDGPIQLAGGENNAFTNSDITNYYNIVPAQNLETILWLESDRMNKLEFSQESLDVQKKVVVEEFNETCLNRPYGDVWHHLSAMAYKEHSYRWPTIGLVPEHVKNANLDDVKSFFYSYYRPNNAILVLSGNITLDKAKKLSKKWFGDIDKGEKKYSNITQEKQQNVSRFKEVYGEVPSTAFYLAFHMPERLHVDYPVCDLLSDALANGRSSRLYQKFCKEEQICSTIDAYISGSIDPGLFIIEGKLMPEYSIEQTMQKIWACIDEIKSNPLENRELQKLKNKVESGLVYSEVNILNKAMNLAFFEHIGDIELINKQSKIYQEISTSAIQKAAITYLTKENSNLLVYYPN